MTPDALAHIHGLCFTTPRPWTAQEFADLLASNGAFLITDGPAFVLGRAIAGEAELLTIAVHPDARRTGIARRLLQRFDDEATGQHASDAFLEVAANNPAAIALYLSAGWHDAGLRKGYYATPTGDRIDARVMRKELAHP